MRTILSATVAAILLTLSSGGARADLTGADREFATQAMQDNISELQKAQSAQSFSASEPLKQLAQKIVKNRSTANAELKAVAEHQQFSLPSQPRAGQEDTRSNLRDLKPSEFQKAYTQEEIKAHGQEIALYRKEADSGTDAGLKKYAQQFIPVLQDELKSAQSVQSAK